MGEGARGYTNTHPPFEEGNEAALRHGANSERHLRPIVDELLAELAVAAPWTKGRAFRLAAERWAYAEAECRLRRSDFDEHGLVDDEGEDRRGVDRWHRAEARAAKLALELGLTPAALTRLLSGLSQVDAPAALSGLEALRATGAAIRAAGVLAPASTSDDALKPAGELAEGGADDVNREADEEGVEEVHAYPPNPAANSQVGAS